jgi:hypothetical protein
MRILVFLALLFPALSFGQRYALIDPDLKMPIIYTDSVTVEQIDKGFFPIENLSIDSLVANLNYLKEILNVRQRSKLQSFELKSSNVTISVKRVPFAYGDRYKATMNSISNGLTAVYNLFNLNISNKKNSQHLDKMLKYFKSNKSFFKEPNEIHPKIYNIVVIRD